MFFKKQKMNIDSFIWLSAWGIYVFAYILLRQSELNAVYNTSPTYKLLQIIVLFMLVIKMFLTDKYTVKEFVTYLGIIAVLIINAIVAKSGLLIYSAAFVLSSKNINYRQFIKIDFVLKCLVFVLIVMMCKMNYLPNYSRVINGTTKYALGFYHPNTFGFFAITLALEWLYLRYENLKVYDLFIFVLILWIVKYISSSRTSMWTFLLMLGLTVILKMRTPTFIMRYIHKMLILLPLICASFSFLMVWLYAEKSPYGYALNTLFTTRIAKSYNFIKTYGIHLFGTQIEVISTRQSEILKTQSNILDMGYIRIAINNGWLVLILFIITLMVLQMKAIEQKNYSLLICSTFFIIIGIAETYIYTIAFNFVFIALFPLIQNRVNSMEKRYKSILIQEKKKWKINIR